MVVPASIVATLQTNMVFPDADRSCNPLCNRVGNYGVADIHVVAIRQERAVHLRFLTELCASVGILQWVDDLRNAREP